MNSICSSFEFCLFKIQIDSTLDGICSVHFPLSLRESTVLHCCIFDYLAVTLQSNFIHFLRLHHISNQTRVTKELTTDERNMEVNRLLGWAFHARVNDIITKYRDQHFGRNFKKGDGGTTFRGFLRARTKKAADKSETLMR